MSLLKATEKYNKLVERMKDEAEQWDNKYKKVEWDKTILLDKVKQRQNLPGIEQPTCSICFENVCIILNLVNSVTSDKIFYHFKCISSLTIAINECPAFVHVVTFCAFRAQRVSLLDRKYAINVEEMYHRIVFFGYINEDSIVSFIFTILFMSTLSLCNTQLY